MKQFARDLGLDTSAFDECVDARSFRATVEEGFAEAGALGINATPAFFINGRFLSGAQPFEAFKAIIDDELSN